MNKTKGRIIVKLGSSTLTRGGRALNRAHMLEIVRAVHSLIDDGYEVALVSSGAMAAGREIMDFPKLPPELRIKQMLSSAGQVRLFEIWADLFEIYGQKIGQLLLTKADLENRERYLNARDTLLTLFEYGVVPVINENDAVSTSEIKIGDNDTLASLIGVLAEADLVVLLTDQNGLYDKDPRKNADARLIKRVDRVDESVLALAGGAGSDLGTGGMLTKIRAAQIAQRAGVGMVIASGDRPQDLKALVEGSGRGTYFTPSDHPSLSRKSWLSSATISQGLIRVDNGAKNALERKGSSLLPSGIKEVTGEFLRGATVDIADESGRVIARGISRYSSGELKKIAGVHSDAIEGILGFTHGDVAVHRDDLVLK